MKFACYNDFELLYLVKEGSEQALNILYLKYSIYIKKLAKRYFPYGDKRNDLVQEGLMLLHKGIQAFRPEGPVPFYAYFSIILNRRFACLIQRDRYYRSTCFLSDAAELPDKAVAWRQSRAEYFLTDELDILLFQEHILEGLSLSAFARKHGIGYGKAYYRRKTMLEEIKKVLTNLPK